MTEKYHSVEWLAENKGRHPFRIKRGRMQKNMKISSWSQKYFSKMSFCHTLKNEVEFPSKQSDLLPNETA